MALRTAVFGASGYAGGELIRLLGRHREVELGQVFAQSSAGLSVDEVHAWYHGPELRFESYAGAEQVSADLCFLALPHGEAMQVAPELLAAGKRVIDLSGDHRLQDNDLFARFYHRKQTSSALGQAVYGLPEWNASEIASARLLSNPGCYATSAILALAPLLADHLIDPRRIVITSMSGVSGAGRKAEVGYSFSEVNESAKAYRVGDHQHIPEIEMALSKVAGERVEITFVPHLIPITRGILTTVCTDLAVPVGSEEIAASFRKHYEREPFVRFRADRLPEIKRVAQTNFIDIGFQMIPERNQVIVVSAIDNLLKGAAGQAVQNMNIACGFAVQEGLL